jgi:hypothetical protein
MPAADGNSEAAAVENEQGTSSAGEMADAAADETAAEVPTLRLSELLPDPVGHDTDGEFIELENFGPAEIELAGCRLAIPGKRDHDLPAITLAAYGFYYFLFAETGLTLTNSGATLQLSCAEQELSSVSYAGPATEGSSYALNAAGLWRWTTELTPGRMNVFPAPTAPANLDDAATTSGQTTAAISPAAATETAATPEPSPSLPDAATATGLPVAVNELLPDPEGNDGAEWIELRNDGETAADLTGWRLDDAEGGSQAYDLPTGTTIAAGGLLLVPRSASALALNNDGDEVRLFDPAGALISDTAYGQATTGRSWSWDSLGWSWSEPTPGQPNHPAATEDTADQDAALAGATAEDGGGSAPGSAAAPPLSVAEAAAAGEASGVTVSGIVNIAPGAFGKTLFAIQDQDGGAGLLVRLYGTPPLAPASGDEVVLAGRLTETASGPCLNISAKTGLRTIRGGSAIAPIAVPPADLPDLNGPLLVTLAGEITKTGSGWFKLADDTGDTEIKVRPLPGPQPAPLKTGDRVSLVGVWRSRTSGAELYLTSRPKLLAPRPAEKAVEPTPARPSLNIDLAPDLRPSVAAPWRRLWPIAAAAAGCAAGGAYLLYRRREAFDQSAVFDVDK